MYVTLLTVIIRPYIYVICIYTRKLATVPLIIYHYYSTAVGGQNQLVHTQVMITYSIPTEKTDKEKEEQQQEKEEEVVVVGHETGPEYTHSQSVSQDMRRDTSIYRQSVHANERSLPRRVVGRGAAPHCPPAVS
jgi:hypothetical protein